MRPAVWTGSAVVVDEVTVHRGVPEQFLAEGPFVLVRLDLGGLELITRWQDRPDDAGPGTVCSLRWSQQGWPLAAPVNDAGH
ncbi:hypothetical protein ET495_04220 [Xylanimonas allomyrinae]|uniref:Uncharacterized protein n=1 Tax=Xylanimonas allomyrinae TaxID=2509459 RepID=A0A4P6EQL4_9MICO|nr:hypothetical protein [Xylanimonas allomyrinae]QAY62587.1 hypothetical protein ET495_04220 [Xylanimonas allomyrinae]